MKSSILSDITLCKQLKVNVRHGGICSCLLDTSLFLGLLLEPQNIGDLFFRWLRGVVFHNTKLFFTLLLNCNRYFTAVLSSITNVCYFSHVEEQSSSVSNMAVQVSTGDLGRSLQSYSLSRPRSSQRRLSLRQHRITPGTWIPPQCGSSRGM
jgi:hypothetical protein